MTENRSTIIVWLVMALIATSLLYARELQTSKKWSALCSATVPIFSDQFHRDLGWSTTTTSTEEHTSRLDRNLISIEKHFSRRDRFVSAIKSKKLSESEEDLAFSWLEMIEGYKDMRRNCLELDETSPIVFEEFLNGISNFKNEIETLDTKLLPYGARHGLLD